MTAITLHPLTAVDAGELYGILADPAMYSYVDEQPPASAQQLAARFDRWAARRSPDRNELWLNWVVRVGPLQAAAGYVQATIPLVAPARAGSAEIGYMIGARFWGQGIGRRAVEQLLATLATQWGVSAARACVDPDNLRSVRLLESVGMQLEGVDPMGGTWRGRTVAEASYSMTLPAG